MSMGARRATPSDVRFAGRAEAGSLFEATPECLVMTSADGMVVDLNAQAEGLTGFTRVELVGKHVELMISANVLDAAPGTVFETFCRHASGASVPVEIRVGVIEEPERLLVITLRDISERLATREARFEAEAKYQGLVEHLPAVVYLDPTHPDAPPIYVSPQAEDLLGITPREWMEDRYARHRHVHPEDADRAYAEYERAYRDRVPLNHQYRMVHEDGTVRWVLEQAFPIDDGEGNPWVIQGVIFDITQQKLAEEQVAFLAYHDKLTGLPNRPFFEEMLETSIARARRHDLAVGVLYLDLDNFKLVNDSLGHHAGDLLLVQLADRLRVCTRDSDLVARQGGDEFLLLLGDLDRGTDDRGGSSALHVAETVATRVREALAEPFDLNGTRFYVSGSTGISMFPDDAQDAASLLKNADTAMYLSKKREPGGFVVFASGGHDAMGELTLTSRLREAVQHERWRLHWQPVVDLATGGVVGAEALVLMVEADGGLVSPGQFIPLAEELGLIEEIGDWVFAEVARQRCAWRGKGLDLKLSLNLSPRQLWSARMEESLLARFRAGDVDPHDVVIEITESTAMADPERTFRVLDELRRHGFTLALDDFGTGYSSLARLKHLPVSILKIDRTFVHDVHRDPELASMVRAMIQLAQGLQMMPLAEGVEEYGEYEFLRANGCLLAQGYLFSRPVPAEELARLATREGGLVPSPA
jgi:diguanylate cyclase (GGDEF)-like protein/PAS domain S-box-containing protein